MKDEALSKVAAERDALAQRLSEIEQTRAARLKAGSAKVKQQSTDDVKVDKAPRTCLQANVDTYRLLADQVEGPGKSLQSLLLVLCASHNSVSCRLQKGRTALTVAIHGNGEKVVRM